MPIQNVSRHVSLAHFAELFLLPRGCSQTYLGMLLTPLRMISVCSQLKATGPKLCASEEDSPSVREIHADSIPKAKIPADKGVFSSEDAY